MIYIHGVNNDNSKGLIQKADARRDHAIPLSLYKNAIDYSLVKVHNASYFPFDLQNEETAVTPREAAIKWSADPK